MPVDTRSNDNYHTSTMGDQENPEMIGCIFDKLNVSNSTVFIEPNAGRAY